MRRICMIILLSIALGCAGVQKKKTEITAQRDALSPEKAYSMRGKIKLRVVIKDKKMTCTMHYCYDKGQEEFYANFTGPMNKNMGILHVNKQEIFFYGNELDAYFQADSNGSSFSRLSGLTIEPFSFIGLLQGIFSFPDAIYNKERIDNTYVNRYYRNGKQWIVERRERKGDMLKGVYFYRGEELYTTVVLAYEEALLYPERVDMFIHRTGLRIILEKGKQERLDGSECSKLDLSKYRERDAIDTSSYDAE